LIVTVPQFQNQFYSGTHLKFGINIFQVKFHRAVGNTERCSNQFIAFALQQKFYNLLFTLVNALNCDMLIFPFRLLRQASPNGWAERQRSSEILKEQGQMYYCRDEAVNGA
jgi:hypothetical protein